MAILAKNNSAPRELTPAGNYIARCYSMVEIGHVIEVIQGVSKELHKVRIGWEFPNELKVFSPEKGEQPLTFSEEYTLSMNEKSNLRKMLASWRGQDFSQKEAESFDITKLLGKTCMVNIIHKPKASDPSIIYANIGSVSSVPKGLPVPDQINPTFELSFDNWDEAKFNTLPEFIKNKIVKSKEYLNVVANGKHTGHADGRPAPARDDNGNTFHATAPEAIDDLPF